MSDAVVDDNRDEERFDLRLEGHLAHLYYELDGRRLVLVHTEVPEELGGRGLGGTLVRAAVARARSDGLMVVPVCPFARQWLERHADAVADVAVDWNAPLP